MATQGISVYENASIPATPAAGYRVLYPVSTGWKELDSAGNARFFAKLDADNASLTVAGGLSVGTTLSFTGASSRIYWPNSATISERLFFQTSTADANSVFHVAPNGAGTQSSIALHNSSDTTNYTRLFIGANASSGFIQTGNFGSGTAIPLDLYSTGVLGLSISTTGYVTIPTGLNVGSATGATTGMIKASDNLWLTKALDATTARDYARIENAGYSNLYIGAKGYEFYFSSAPATLAGLSVNVLSGATTVYGGLNVGTATGAAAGAWRGKVATGEQIWMRPPGDFGAGYGPIIQAVDSAGTSSIQLVLAGSSVRILNELRLDISTSASATAGGGATLPATVAGYLVVNVAGTNRKVPYYAT